jgi:hypothetical protein
MLHILLTPSVRAVEEAGRTCSVSSPRLRELPTAE